MDEGSYQVNRRKACDLCFHKKIKCDMLRPMCSNCELYKAHCKTTKHRRKYGRGKYLADEQALGYSSNHVVGPGQMRPGQTQLESMEKRLEDVEQQLAQAIGTNFAAIDFQQAQPAGVPFFPHQNSTLSNRSYAEMDHSLVNHTSLLMYDPFFDLVPSADESQPAAPNSSAADLSHNSTSEKTLRPSLPPMAEIKPIVDYYFTHINPLIPLFSQRRFNAMLQDYYTSACQYPEATWAAVNVVLGLAACLPTSPSSNLEFGHSDVQTAKYIENVRKLLPELLICETNLLVVQVLLGLVIISQALKESHHAVIFIGLATRLAQRLRLQSRDDNQCCSLEAKVERERVFWIAYLYDKDICLRYHTPSVQDDADVDVDLPEEDPVDDLGIVYTVDGLARFNFIRHRIHLAHIQGQVYDLLFSNKSARVTSQERGVRVAILHKQLEQWMSSIPSEFQAENVGENVSRTARLWICMMHFSYLSCLVMVHGIWSHDAEWRKRLTIRPIGTSFSGDVLDRSKLHPPLPPGWRNCVQMSRSCMSLISRIPLSDCNVWANGCAYFSALLILETNLIEYPLASHVDSDLHLTGFAVKVLDKMSEVSSIMAMKRMNIVAAELDRQARFVVSEARRSLLVNGCNSLADDPAVATIDQRIVGVTPQPYSKTVKWDWGKEGVEAWPEMDFTIRHVNW